MSKYRWEQASRVLKHKAGIKIVENNCMQQQYHKIMVNSTGNNDPDPVKQIKHHTVSTVNNVTQEVYDTNGLKKNL